MELKKFMMCYLYLIWIKTYCVGPLKKHKYSLHFEGDRCIIYDKRDRRQILTQVRMVNKSFTFFLRYINDVVRRENVMDDS